VGVVVGRSVRYRPTTGVPRPPWAALRTFAFRRSVVVAVLAGGRPPGRSPGEQVTSHVRVGDADRLRRYESDGSASVGPFVERGDGVAVSTSKALGALAVAPQVLSDSRENIFRSDYINASGVVGSGGHYTVAAAGRYVRLARSGRRGVV
jgi:hypothetical protein